MSNEDEQKDGSINISSKNDISGSVIGANVNIGSYQYVGGDLTINTGAFGNAAAGSVQADLKALLEELQAALRQVPAEHAEEAEMVRDKANQIAEEAAKPSPRKKWLQVEAEGLKKAAENLASVMPTVLQIAAKIVML